MREHSLRSVLLVKSIEEADKTGALITAAERIAASREARRDAPLVARDDAAALSSSAERMLSDRAMKLEARIVERHPFIATVRDAAFGSRLVSVLVFALAVVIGVGLSALDGTQRINLLAPGLIGLIVWNLFVYAWLVVSVFRRRAMRKGRPIPRLLAHNAMQAMLKLIARSAAFNAALASALQSFSREWIETARPLLLARASRLIHTAAAAIGLGLIAGLYARGVASDYLAGWESTFLDPSQVRALFAVLYGPASLASGIALPDVAQVEALRWTANGGGGERAARWIHLLAASVAIHVVLPRLLLALLSTLAIARWSWRMPVPPSLPSYFRSVFGAVDSTIGRGIVMVAPYAHAVPPESIARLREWLPAAFGKDLAVDMREPVAYGSEEDFVRHLGDRGGTIADVIVLLFNLASTPEEENHGTLIASVRDWIAANRPHAQLLVLLDAGSYTERMGNDTGRVDERRRAWERFVADRGLACCTLDLQAPLDDPGAASTALRQALWQPGLQPG